MSKQELILRAHKVVEYFAKTKKDARSIAMVYKPERYRSMMKVFRASCYVFNERDIADWEEIIKTIKTQERCKQKSLS